MTKGVLLEPGTGLTEELVIARGRRFRAVRASSGEPLVVFESGLGTGASAWAAVQREVAKRTATLALDRAGIGGSQPAKDGRRFTDINSDLEAVLDAVGYGGPLILVGQSWGGPIMRAFSHHTRRPLAGVVLVDGTKATVMTSKEGNGLRVYFGLLGKLSRVGLHRKLRGRLIDNITSGMSDEDGARVIRDMMSARAARAGAAESAGLAAEADELGALEDRGFPDGVPVTLLAAAQAEAGTEEMRARFVASQRAEGEALGQRIVVVPDSRHDIHMHKSQLVVDEILRLVESYQRKVADDSSKETA